MDPTSEEYLACGLPDMHAENAEPPSYQVSFDVDGVPIILYFSEKQADNTYNVVSSMFPEKIVSVPADAHSYLEKDLLAWLARYPFQQWIITVAGMEIRGAGADVKFALIHGRDKEAVLHRTMGVEVLGAVDYVEEDGVEQVVVLLGVVADDDVLEFLKLRFDVVVLACEVFDAVIVDEGS